MIKRSILRYLVISWIVVSGCRAAGTAMMMAGETSGSAELAAAGKSIQQATREFTEEEKYYVGRTVAANLLARSQPVRYPLLVNYVNAIGSTIVSVSPIPETFRGWRFVVLDANDQRNAFSTPGGFVFMTSGLLKTLQSEDELAAVFAHEIAHVGLDHPMGAISASHQRDAIAKMARLGLKTAGQESREVKALTGVFDAVVGDVMKAVANGYSQDKEGDADRLAVDLLQQSGYSPRALVDVLKRIEGDTTTHGSPAERAAAVEKVIQEANATVGIEPIRTKRFVGVTQRAFGAP